MYMPRRPQHEAQLIRDYAREFGISERTARNHRSDPRAGGQPRQQWIDWLAARNAKPTPAPANGGTPSIAPMSNLDRATRAVNSAWRLLETVRTQAALTTDPTQLSIWTRTIRDAQRAYNDSARELDAAQRTAGELVSAATVRAAFRELSASLSDILTRTRSLVSNSLPFGARHKFLQAWDAGQVDLQSALHQLDARLESIMNND